MRKLLFAALRVYWANEAESGPACINCLHTRSYDRQPIPTN
jgi:hypothetical protein